MLTSIAICLSVTDPLARPHAHIVSHAPDLPMHEFPRFAGTTRRGTLLHWIRLSVRCRLHDIVFPQSEAARLLVLPQCLVGWCQLVID